MPTKRLTMRRIHRLMTLRFGAGASDAGDCAGAGHLAQHGARVSGADRRGGDHLAAASRMSPTRSWSSGCSSMAASGPEHAITCEPDWAAVARELKRPGVNLMILWEEYRAVHPDGYAYSRYCQLFREFERRLSPSMRQTHVAGDKAFVDFSGKKVPIIDPATGVVREAEIFVAVLGASNLTYAEATWTQGLPDWIGAHVRMFPLLGCEVLASWCPTISRAACTRPRSTIPRSTAVMAPWRHIISVGILPARPYHPKDKAKVEAGVRIAQFYVLGRLRNLKFFSLAECNAAITEILVQLNGRVMRRLGVSRRELFETVERPAMQPLPADRARVCRMGVRPGRH